MNYKTIDEVPEEGRELIRTLVEDGIIEIEDDTIDLPIEVYQMLIILAKLGYI